MKLIYHRFRELLRMIIKQGGKSPHRYCGARLWIDHSKTHLPLRSRLYEYWGAVTVEGNVYHRFYAYRHGGGKHITHQRAGHFCGQQV
jgi:hypothetical protein